MLKSNGVIDERSAMLYAKLPEFRYLVTKTKSFIRWALAKVQHPYVACSFGKDSSVMLHLVLQERKDIAVKFLGKVETSLIDDYDSVIKWWESNYPVHVERIIYTGWLEDREAKTGIAENITDEGFDSFFVGLRKEESVGRRITLNTHGKYYKAKNGKIRIAPLADWQTKDIAAYMLSNGLPVLSAYKREGFSARTTSNIPSKYPHEAIARLKDADIDSYNKLIQLLPDAKYYT